MNLNRRHLFSAAAAVGFQSMAGNRLCRALDNQLPSGKFRRCLVLWMEGGPSQLDTFDPKPGGDRNSVPSKIPGVRFADSMRSLAGRADELCLLRSVGSREGEHTRATELLHTGFAPIPSFPRPPLGSFVSENRDDPGFPRFVTLGGIGFGPAFLGSQHASFVIEELDSAKDQLERIGSKKNALALLNEFNRSYSAAGEALANRNAAIDSVRSLLDTRFPEAIDVESASPSDRNRYGDTAFGRRVLTARRLLEMGVPFVEAQLGGWDTHIDNLRRTNQLCDALQTPWVALMDDLQRSGLWDDTLIVWMGEFGRTPKLNGRAGRDHFPESTPVVLAGGHLGGRVVGQTSPDGSRRIGETHSVADLMATMMQLLGLDPDASLTTDFGSPTTATDNGTPIKAITA